MQQPSVATQATVLIQDIVFFYIQILIVLPILSVVTLCASAAKLVYCALVGCRSRASDPQQQHLNVLITGASAGIGKALALAYAKRAQQSGAATLTLALVARRTDVLDQLAQEITSLYKNVSVIVSDSLDVTNRDGLRDFIENVDARVPGGLHVVYANAGISEPMLHKKNPLLSDEEINRQVFDVNLTGVFNTVYPALDVFAANSSARSSGPHRRQIAIVSSIAAQLSGSTPYSISKLAVQEFGRMIRSKLQREGSSGVGLTVVLPGFVSTDMANTYFESTQSKKFGPAGLFMMSSEQASQIIIDGVQQNLEIVAFPQWQLMLLRVLNFLPFSLQQVLYSFTPSDKKNKKQAPSSSSEDQKKPSADAQAVVPLAPAASAAAPKEEEAPAPVPIKDNTIDHAAMDVEYKDETIIPEASLAAKEEVAPASQATSEATPVPAGPTREEIQRQLEEGNLESLFMVLPDDRIQELMNFLALQATDGDKKQKVKAIIVHFTKLGEKELIDRLNQDQIKLLLSKLKPQSQSTKGKDKGKGKNKAGPGTKDDLRAVFASKGYYSIFALLTVPELDSISKSTFDFEELGTKEEKLYALMEEMLIQGARIGFDQCPLSFLLDVARYVHSRTISYTTNGQGLLPKESIIHYMLSLVFSHIIEDIARKAKNSAAIAELTAVDARREDEATTEVFAGEEQPEKEEAESAAMEATPFVFGAPAASSSDDIAATVSIPRTPSLELDLTSTQAQPEVIASRRIVSPRRHSVHAQIHSQDAIEPAAATAPVETSKEGKIKVNADLAAAMIRGLHGKPHLHVKSQRSDDSTASSGMMFVPEESMIQEEASDPAKLPEVKLYSPRGISFDVAKVAEAHGESHDQLAFAPRPKLERTPRGAEPQDEDAPSVPTQADV